MPKLPTDFSKCIMYQIICLEKPELFYIGYTTNFNVRKNCHKSWCNKETSGHYNLKVYQTIRENGGWENFRMIQLEEYPCNSKKEAEARETQLIIEMKPPMNSRLSVRDPNYDKNYYQTHKEQELAYNKKYREKNKDKIKEYSTKYNKQYWEKTKEIQKEKHKIWREANREKLLEDKKEWYQKNKERIALEKKLKKQNDLA